MLLFSMHVAYALCGVEPMRWIDMGSDMGGAMRKRKRRMRMQAGGWRAGLIGMA
jgi:hypothetical protein